MSYLKNKVLRKIKYKDREMSNMTDYEKHYELFRTQPIEQSFQDFKICSSEGARAFKDYYKNTFKELVNFSEQTMSTNHVTYVMSYNDDHKYFHIVRYESGCFHSSEDILTIEDIKQQKEQLEKEFEKRLLYYSSKDMSWEIKMHNYQLEPLNAIIEAYDKIQNKIKMEQELENKSTSNKPKI